MPDHHPAVRRLKIKVTYAIGEFNSVENSAANLLRLFSTLSGGGGAQISTEKSEYGGPTLRIHHFSPIPSPTTAVQTHRSAHADQLTPKAETHQVSAMVKTGRSSTGQKYVHSVEIDLENV